jgi:hypothetical protein
VRPLSAVALDLSEATGRAHAAWWARSLHSEHTHRVWRNMPTLHAALALAESGNPMTTEQIETFRLGCLRLAELLEAP